MSKKAIALLLAAVLCAAALAGCGSSGKQPQPTFPPDKEEIDLGPEPDPASRPPVYTTTLDNGLTLFVFYNGVSNYKLLLEHGDVEENLKNLPQFGGYLPNINKLEIGKGVEIICDKAFKDWTALKEVYFAPDTRIIGEQAFSGCTGLTDVDFDDAGITSIGKYAFSGCTALRNVKLCESVAAVGDKAFSGCKALEEATFGSGVLDMGDYVFEGCDAFQDFTTGSNIPDQAFENSTTLKILTLRNTVKKIGDYAFSGCTALDRVSWSDELTSIGSHAFNGCKALKKLELSHLKVDKLSIRDGAFLSCSGITDINLPCVKELTLGLSAFEGCSALTEIDLPEGVTRISERAFAECTSLTKIILPVSLKSIGYEAFSNTPKVRVLAYRGTAMQFNLVKKDSSTSKDWNKGAKQKTPTKYEYKND